MLHPPLRWPPEFPPRNGWSRFFLGIRWLGPDVSFFRRLQEQQAARGPEVMTAWPTDDEREAALVLGRLLEKHVGWPTPYFLPDDSFAVVAYGPKLVEMDSPFDDFKTALEAEVGTNMPSSSWDSSFGAVARFIAPLLRART
jgi:hypothetical protein